MKQGLIFSLDAAIAVTVVIIMVINSSYYTSTSNKESVSQLQLVKLGNDVMKIIHADDTLQDIVLKDYASPASPTSVISDDDLNYSIYIPPGYAMKFTITDMKESLTDETTLQNGLDCGGLCSCDGDSCTGNNTQFATLPIERTDNIYYLKLSYTDTSTPNVGFITATVNGYAATYNLSATTNLLSILNQNFTLFQGANTITFDMHPSGEVDLHWFRVIGSQAYAGETSATVPTDRFVGTGQRVFSVDNNGEFVGMNIARFFIWLK